MDAGNVTGIGHIQIAEGIFSMRVIFFTFPRVLLSLYFSLSDCILLTCSLFSINLKGPKNLGTMHLVSDVRTWTGFSCVNAFYLDKRSHTAFIV